MSRFPGKKNVYLCEKCGHGFVTMDIDDGTTPFMTTCLNCENMAKSMCYNIPQALLGTPALTWVRPKPSMWGTFSPGIRDLLEKGGLIRSDTKGLQEHNKRLLFRQ